MNFEFEVFDDDLRDRELIIEMRAILESQIDKLGEFSKNNLVNQLNYLRSSIESVENKWLFWQRERILNKLSEVLNVDRSKLGDKCWHDD